MRTLRMLVIVTALVCHLTGVFLQAHVHAQSLAEAEAVLFEDDFTANTNAWTLGHSDSELTSEETRIVGGKLQTEISFAQDAISWKNVPNLVAQNFALSVEAALVDATGEFTQITLTFREDEAGNYYVIQFDSDNSYLVQRYYANEWQTLQDWTTSSALDLQPGVVNTFHLVVEDALFTIYANGEELTTIEDTTLTTAGQIGLGVGGSQGEEAVVTFDNLLLTGAAPTVEEAPAAVDEQLAAIHETAPTVSDEFRTMGDDWYTESSEVVRYEHLDRAFQITLRREEQSAWSVNPQLYAADFLAEFDVMALTGVPQGQMGLAFRIYDADNYYYYAINSDGEYALQRKLNGEWTTLIDWTADDSLNTGKRTNNRLGLLAQGDQLVLLANDIILAEVEDTALVQGYLGLAVGTVGHPIQKALFDNLDFWLLRAAQPTYPAPTSAPAEVDIADALNTIRNTAVTLSDDFRRDQGRWTVADDESQRLAYDERAFRIEVLEPQILASSQSTDVAVADLLLEVDMTYTAGPTEAEMGLLFRYVDEDNFYIYVISPLGTYSLWKKADGVWEQLLPWTASAAIVTGIDVTNRIGVMAVGEEITLVVNDVGLAQVTDESFAEGQVGMTVGAFSEAGAVVLFDNLDLWTIE